MNARRASSRLTLDSAPRRGILRSLCILVAVQVAAAARPVAADEILVFAAASLTDALQVIGREFDAASGHTTRFNFAGSNALAMQIRSGARADVFFSADEDHMQSLAKEGLVREDTKQDLLSNRLVIVVERTNPVQFDSLAMLAAVSIERIAIGEPHSVPAGKYAKRALETVGLWAALVDRCVPTENVRAALAAVEAGNVDAAIVYRTDAAISKKVRVAYEIEGEAAPRIVYPVAGLHAGRAPDAAAAFLAWLAGPAAAAVFERFGFIVLVS